ncbi:extracellular solute-binding protein [Ensifer sp. ENS07]|uniref:extracellular solute-binding protein n=1 Tax=Ensifer sp. ENS07 TaxID=2769274 RepID=UPI00177FC83F|nr:extracellular solute-binding protein [Ensifer sp. ENS07]MBD9641746.1 extracellular solute-binding protein [Ensifer sp. ENS07]
MNRNLLRSLALAATVASSAIASAQDSITVVSFGGDTKLREETSFYKPFEKETGIKVVSVDYSGGIAQIKAQVEAGAVSWDVVNGENALANQGCDEGYLEELSSITLSPGSDGTPADKDYLPGAVVKCGVGVTAWTAAIGYQENLPVKPATIADVFDTKKIPGKRGFIKSATYVLEFALEADGVPAKDVYAVLSTREGVDRAFKKLDTIKNDIVWWDSWSQGMQLIVTGEVAMGMSSSQRLLVAKGQRELPIGILFDGQIAQMDVYMVPKGTAKWELVKKYLEFISRPEIQKNLYVSEAEFKGAPDAFRSKSLPTRVSVLKEIKFDAVAQPAVDPFIGKASSAVVFDDGTFWPMHREEIERRFASWLQQ